MRVRGSSWHYSIGKSVSAFRISPCETDPLARLLITQRRSRRAGPHYTDCAAEKLYRSVATSLERDGWADSSTLRD